jgi:3-hydroxyisobutyrate dehydrogenase
MKVGIAGVGRMGAAVGERLMSQGHQLVVWNRNPEKAKALVAKGATVAATPAALAGEAEVVITLLSDAGAIDSVYRGPEGLLTGKCAGKLFIEMSTVRPEVERKLASDVAAKSARMIECPVGGTTGPAKEGRLLGFVGGEAADVARAKPLLDQMCRRHEHVGAVGAGAAMKLAINLPLLVWYQACGEALTLCNQVGLDPARLMDIFADTSGAPTMLKARAPKIAEVLKGIDPQPTNDVDLARKDLRTMLDEAQSLGANLPVAEKVLEIYDRAAKEGWGARDQTTLASYWPRQGKA